MIDQNGRIYSQLDREDHPLRKLVRYGYVFVVADVRGAGASFGTRIDPHPPREGLDAYDITEWLAAQPWCNGRVGMYGISYSGTAQLMAAGAAPPHLKAIFPEMVMFDLYDFCYPGGIYRHTLMKGWQQQVRGFDLSQIQRAAPVDEDQSQTLLAQAIAQHQGNFDVSKAGQAPFRDSILLQAEGVYTDNNPSTCLNAVNKSGVPVYLRAGWFDMYPRDMLLWFCHLTNPRKIAYLEDIDAQGRSTYITEGCLRASHRAISKPSHLRLDLPYHSGLEKDVAKLPHEPVELVFDLLPTGKHFPAGHRIRIAVTGADKDSYQTPQDSPAPTITVFRDTQHPSYVILPVVD